MSDNLSVLRYFLEGVSGIFESSNPSTSRQPDTQAQINELYRTIAVEGETGFFSQQLSQTEHQERRALVMNDHT
ncbi:MAG: hypothetical protein HY785_00070 [Oscillatoriophycideae cyanobacterium NC_groundwater_1537_Pr4_S-0.65um_50_18]|nr:hypothetical protein [Oscillatoriophycideae cyanobacterium NC_groundwater_1537_Pr4_S-0.65um_50_18]